MKTTLVIFAALLFVLTLIGAFGGSVRHTEPFFDDAPPVGGPGPMPPAPPPPASQPPPPGMTSLQRKPEEQHGDDAAPPPPTQQSQPPAGEAFYQGTGIEPFDQYDGTFASSSSSV